MIAAAPHLQQQAGAGEWLSVAEVQVLLKISDRRVRQLCDEKWVGRGLARRVDGEWRVHPAADHHLTDHRTWARRDLEARIAFRQQGVKPEHVAIAERRLEILQRWGSNTDRGPAEVVFERFKSRLLAEGVLPCEGVTHLSLATVYRWDKDYERDGLRGLLPQFSRRGRRRTAIGEHALLHCKNLLLGGNKMSFTTAYIITRGEAEEHAGEAGWEWPSPDKARRAVRKLLPLVLLTMAGKGERTAKANHVPKMQRDFEAIPAGDEYVGDERTLDVRCRVLTARGWKAVRPKLTAWLDMRGRMLVGWELARCANSRTILSSLKRAIREHGKPLILRTDWGEDYKKAARHGEIRERGGSPACPPLPGILADLGIAVHPTAAPYSPWCKPIESFFRTMKEHLDKLFAAFWGGCPSERHEDRAKWLRDNLERLPTIDDVAAALGKFIDLYHRTPHSAPDMFGKSPLEAMEAFRSGPIRVESEAVLHHLFAEFIGPKLVRRDGIRWNGRWYGNGDARLVAMQGQKVLLAIQPDNQGRATVCKLDRSPLFDVECLPVSGLNREEVAELHRQRHRMLRPYREQVRAAARFMQGTTPERLLDRARAGVEAVHGKREGRGGPAARVTVLRPAMEEAISNAGPAPSEAASKAVRTGTDDDAITLDDMLGGPVPGIAEAVSLHDDADDGISWEDMTGEL